MGNIFCIFRSLEFISELDVLGPVVSLYIFFENCNCFLKDDAILVTISDAGGFLKSSYLPSLKLSLFTTYKLMDVKFSTVALICFPLNNFKWLFDICVSSFGEFKYFVYF